jgi:hypothetical protein
VKCTHVMQPHVVKWMHTAPYLSVISYVDCDVSFCSEYLYLGCLMLLQEARNFIHKWSMIKNAANTTKLKLITCFERARLRFVPTFYYFRKSSWLNCCRRHLPVNNVFENRLLCTSGELRLGRYLWNAGTIGCVFARRGYVTQRLLCVQKRLLSRWECASSKCPSRNRSLTRLQRLWDPPVISLLGIRAYLSSGLAVRTWDCLHVGLRCRMG